MGHLLGVASLIALAPTALALYRYRLAGWWRRVYVIGATIALYLNVFIAVLQAFKNIALLHMLEPTPSVSPYLVAQLVALPISGALGVLAMKRIRPFNPLLAFRA